MTLPLANTFEGGSNGSGITAGNSGGASGNAFDSASAGAGSSITYDNGVTIKGSLVAKCSQTAGIISNAEVKWTTSSVGSPTEVWGRVYFRLSALPTTNGLRPVMLFDTNGTTGVGMIEITTAGVLRVANGTFSSTTSGTGTAVAANTTYRLEFYCKAGGAGTAVMTANLYLGDSTSAINTATRQSEAGGSAVGTARMGLNGGGSGQVNDGATTFTIYIDAIALNATGYPGPVAPTPTLLPSADSVDGAWTDQAAGTSLAAAIDETTASDTDYIQSEISPVNSGCRVKLAAGEDPLSSTGHILHWRAGKDAGGNQIDMTVKLYQGGGNSLGAGTLIASFTRNNVGAFTTYDETLSGAQADSITNYADLYLEFYANQV